MGMDTTTGRYVPLPPGIANQDAVRAAADELRARPEDVALVHATEEQMRRLSANVQAGAAERERRKRRRQQQQASRRANRR